MQESSFPTPEYGGLSGPVRPYLDLNPSDFGVDPSGSPQPLDYRRVIKRYLALSLLLMFFGAAAGFVLTAYVSPTYRARAMVEVEPLSVVLPKNELSTLGSSSQLDIQTDIQVLRSATFLRRVLDRLQLETVPPPPIQNDIFSRVRRRIRTNVQDPLAQMKEGLNFAVTTFSARPVNETRIIEITCDSTTPEIASAFVNTVANEYIEQSLQQRTQTAQQTNQWLTGQLEETRNRLQEAQQKLQEFVQTSGNLFVLQDNTLDNSKLRELQGELSSIQADRIAKQARYELVAKSSPEALPDVLDDVTLRTYQSHLADLRREAAALNVTLTPENPKVKKILAQIAELQKTLKREEDSVLQRMKNDYDAALRREKLLRSAYAVQAAQVSAQATKAAQYNALKRDVDTLQQTYNATLLEANESSISSSVPVNTIRLVDPSTPPGAPYAPRPTLNISFGAMAGLFLAGGFAFLREKTDRRVRMPGHSRHLLRIPELGVIPSIASRGGKLYDRLLPIGKRQTAEPLTIAPSPKVSGASKKEAYQLAESFRVTLASLLRENDGKRQPKVILVSSPGPGEGKTTIVSNLGIALAETGRKVLIIDADFRRPRLHAMFDLENNWGVTNILSADMETASLGISSGYPGLSVLPSGPLPENVPKLLYSGNFHRLLQAARERFDIVLIDAPPILEVADARIIGRLADRSVLVLRSGLTHQADAVEAYQQLHEDGTLLLGTVLNDWKPASRKRDYYYYMAQSEK